ncbi:hypothetical protein SAMN06264364_11541 [Quadrisphaera granulorum]|uniref:Uncharacterized protein n=1 Tax=Quadrisphaera granulorum TaxID=317664 RepID=A0A316A885_9ACTN|nr:hypothetical protein BXY45_11541 [Quadrisphaera granulorum]SZE97189.1 hypothetical protein SAMN06264364_11541 [Quadrisphaera granulorum]
MHSDVQNPAEGGSGAYPAGFCTFGAMRPGGPGRLSG